MGTCLGSWFIRKLNRAAVFWRGYIYIYIYIYGGDLGGGPGSFGVRKYIYIYIYIRRRSRRRTCRKRIYIYIYIRRRSRRRTATPKRSIPDQSPRHVTIYIYGHIYCWAKPRICFVTTLIQYTMYHTIYNWVYYKQALVRGRPRVWLRIHTTRSVFFIL